MTMHKTAKVVLSREAQCALLADIRQRPHIEACGALLGTSDGLAHWYIEQVIPLPNIFNSPVYFEFAPEDLLAVDLAHPGQIIGVYHTHPSGLARASSTDRQNMQRVNQDEQIPWVWLIVSGPFDALLQGEHYMENVTLVAYHHYREGLRQLPIAFEPAEEERASEQTAKPWEENQEQ